MINEKYFELDHILPKPNSYYKCNNNPDSPWFWLTWNLGRPFDLEHIRSKIKEFGEKKEVVDLLQIQIPEPIIYQVDFIGRKKDLIIEDYPPSSSFLISNAMLEVIRTSGANFDKYRSVVIMLDGRQLTNYVSINLTESFSVLDLSKYEFREDGNLKTYYKVIMKRSLIPKDKELFILKEGIERIVSETLKNKLEAAGLKGVGFIPLEITEDES